VYSFGLWNVNIGLDQIIEGPRILCWSARWLGAPGKTVKFNSEVKSDPITMLTQLRDLMDEADVVVGYNSDSFDIPWVNEQLMENGLELPSPFISVDLYKLNKRFLKMPSRKLDYMSWKLLEDRKVKHQGFAMWAACMDPSSPDFAKAWRDMEKYAKQDTYLLEPLFIKMRPFIRNVNYGLFADKNFACTHCGSTALQARGFRYTTAGKFQRYQCNDCGGWSTDPTRIDTTALRPLNNS
jgi:hypothetical protein